MNCRVILFGEKRLQQLLSYLEEHGLPLSPVICQLVDEHLLADYELQEDLSDTVSPPKPEVESPVQLTANFSSLDEDIPWSEEALLYLTHAAMIFEYFIENDTDNQPQWSSTAASIHFHLQQLLSGQSIELTTISELQEVTNVQNTIGGST